MTSFLVPFITAFQLLGAPASAPDPVQVAQVVERSGAEKASNRAASRLAAAQKRERALQSQKRALRATYNRQLKGVDRLKRARASWRRDRQLRDQKARSQKTAIALQALDRKLRVQQGLVKRERKALARAIDRELDTMPNEARRRYLGAMLGKIRVGLHKAPRKISMPDLELDEFADPEELLEQIALIERAEAKLASERNALRRRADHYTHMDALRSKRRRADELGAFDDDNVRRSTGRVGSNKDARTSSEGDGPNSQGGAGLSDDASEPSPSPPGDPESDLSGAGSFESASVVLADVVDSGTQDALRRAQRSSSPRTKAAAARQAQQQVSDRLKRLKASKARIRRHLERLRRH